MMPQYSHNPFLTNTPKSSPIKGGKKTISTPGSIVTPLITDNSSSLEDKITSINANNSRSTSTSTSSHSSPRKRIYKRPSSQTFGITNLSNSLLSSPTRRPKTSSSTITYSDRFIPTRTDIGLNSIKSIASTVSLTKFSNSSIDHDDQVVFQKERQAHETFDTILKNEIFGDLLLKDSTESGINKIENTKTKMIYNHGTNGNSIKRREPSTPSPERHSSYFNLSDTPISVSNGVLIDNDNDNNSDSDDDGNTTNNSGNFYGYNSGSNSERLNSVPITPKKLFSTDNICKPFSNTNRGASIFTYQERSPTKKPSFASNYIKSSQFMDHRSPVRPDSKQLLLSPSKSVRKITKIPYRVLDAPSLADDFYYDLIDWSSTDLLAVALNKSIFLTNNSTGEVIHLCDTEDEYTSLSWVGAGSHLAVGQNNGLIEIYDVTKKKCIRTLSGHVDRVACLSWNNYVLTSGSRDRKILHRDVRTAEPYFQRIETHQQEVCGLKWNINENKLASGGNDNIVNVFDGVSKTPFLTLTEHRAAVKAIAWSPHKRSILATGGGTADRHLKIWNVNNQTKINDVDTNSQICNMLWSKNTDEIITSHGYSKFNLTVWDYPTLDPIAILKGHSFRVLHLTLSADGTTVVSGAGDETLRYWKLFDKLKFRPQTDSPIFSSLNQIR